MGNKINDPIVRLMGLRYKSHPWHGLEVGEDAPEVVTAFIEMVPTDTVKYELDKVSGYIRIDRPQKYSTVVPALYGFIPQSFCGDLVADFCMEKSGRENIKGDGDPLDVCVLTERTISHGDIIASVKPIGGFRMLDGNEADDKIIAVLRNDATYRGYNDVSELPQAVVDRLKHYFLTYKDMPFTENGPEQPKRVDIVATYGREEAYEVITRSLEDYKNHFESLEEILRHV
ncbi:MAG: inorganic pyrophosphatase [Alistipes sp.]|nr:inorganic pyrophosphatase [Alistipes sp.]